MSYRRFGLAIFVTVLFYVVGIFFIQRTVFEVKSFRDAQTWPTVEGRVMRIEVIEEFDSETGSNFIPILTYEYKAGGVLYSGQRTYFSETPKYSANEAALHAFDPLTSGSAITVHYDPSDPGRSFLFESSMNYSRSAFMIFISLISFISPIVVFGKDLFRKRSK